MSGLIAHFSGGADRAALYERLTPQGEVKSGTVDEALAIDARVSANRTIALAFTLCGVAALAAGAALFALMPPPSSEDSKLTATFFPGGGWVGIRGALP